MLSLIDGCQELAVYGGVARASAVHTSGRASSRPWRQWPIAWPLYLHCPRLAIAGTQYCWPVPLNVNVGPGRGGILGRTVGSFISRAVAANNSRARGEQPSRPTPHKASSLSLIDVASPALVSRRGPMKQTGSDDEVTDSLSHGAAE